MPKQPTKPKPAAPPSTPLELIVPAGADMRAAIPMLAYEAAQTAMRRLGAGDYLILCWPNLSLDTHAEEEARIAQAYAAFVRENPDAPAESLFRYGRKAGVHSMPGAQWPDLPALARIAHELFASCVRMLDRAIDRIEAEMAEAQRQAAMAERGPPPPLAVPEDRSIYRKGGKIGARRASWTRKQPAREAQ